jgi:hypothetical protein
MARSTGAMACHRVPAPPRAAAGRERCVARCRRRFASAAPASPGLARAGCDVSATLSSDGTGDGGSPGSVASGAAARRLPKVIPVMDRARLTSSCLIGTDGAIWRGPGCRRSSAVEQLIRNQQALGSSPSVGTTEIGLDADTVMKLGAGPSAASPRPGRRSTAACSAPPAMSSATRFSGARTGWSLSIGSWHAADKDRRRFKIMSRDTGQ